MTGLTQPSPDLETELVRAWRVYPIARDVQDAAHVKEWGHEHTGLTTWLVNGPYHPWWSWWHVSVIHLGDLPGIPPAVLRYPEAEYEFSIYSIDSPPRGLVTPDVGRIRGGDPTARGLFLHPADVEYQFHGVTDAQAVEVCDQAVSAIVTGRSCDRDYRRWWGDFVGLLVEQKRDA